MSQGSKGHIYFPGGLAGSSRSTATTVTGYMLNIDIVVHEDRVHAEGGGAITMEALPPYSTVWFGLL